MTIELYKEIALTKDFPDYRLQKGDVGTIVEQLSNNNQHGYAVEFFNAIGETIAVVVVDQSDVELLREDEVMHARKLETA
jgi:Domain of unknown function (DUF4926)